MLVINNQKRTLHIGSVTLMPGSNVVDDNAIDFKHPILAALIDEGKLSYEKNVTAAVATIAVEKAMRQDIVDNIEKQVKKSSPQLKKAAAARKKTLDEFDAEWDAALKKKKEEKTSQEG